MPVKKIFVFLGNPNNDSLGNLLFEAYIRGAQAAGHEVRSMRVADMRFDPVLHKGYREIQALEPDLRAFQEQVKWCQHFVVFYPIWWSDMPALMKGLIDRVWLPGFAFNFRKGLIPGWYRKLKGKSARVIVTSDQHPFFLWLLFGGNINNFTRGVLRFSGFAPLRRNWISGMQKISPERIERLKKWAERLGGRGK